MLFTLCCTGLMCTLGAKKASPYISIAQKDGVETSLRFGIPLIVIGALLFIIFLFVIIQYNKKHMLDKILAQDCMTAHPVTLKTNDTLAKAATLFQQNPFRHLPIINQSHELAGILTKKDLDSMTKKRKTIDGEYVYDTIKLDLVPIKNAMQKNITYLYPHSSLKEALFILGSTLYGCIPIIDKGKHVKGIITHTDAVNALYQALIPENDQPEITTKLTENNL